MHTGRRATVLVVDDDPLLLRLAQVLLGADHEVLTAGTGREARDVLLDHHVDAMIVDVTMPDESGLDLTRWVRTQPRLANLPVAVATGDVRVATRLAAEEAGADVVLTKPYEPAALCRLVAGATAGVPTHLRRAFLAERRWLTAA